MDINDLRKKLPLSRKVLAMATESPEEFAKRQVRKNTIVDCIISTVNVTEGKRPFETAISHPNYNGGDWMVIEAYDKRKTALSGHKKWVNLIRKEGLPKSFPHCTNSEFDLDDNAFGFTSQKERDNDNH